MKLQPAAIGIIFCNLSNEVLLVKRKDVPIWVLPGGGIDLNESPEEAVIREIKEETGFTVTIQRKSAEYTPINKLSEFTHVFICKIQEGSPIRSSSETDDLGFFPIDTLPKNLFEVHREWIQNAIKYPTLIKRPLTGITYGKLLRYFLCHPWHVIRYAWTRLLTT